MQMGHILILTGIYYENWDCSFAIIIHSFIHSDHFCSVSSSPLLLRCAPNTARILCQNFMLKRQRQLWV